MIIEKELTVTRSDFNTKLIKLIFTKYNTDIHIIKNT